MISKKHIYKTDYDLLGVNYKKTLCGILVNNYQITKDIHNINNDMCCKCMNINTKKQIKLNKKMGNSDWCVWCNLPLKGEKSWRYCLCYQCRQSKEGKEYVAKVDRDSFLIREQQLKGTRSIIPTYEEMKQGKKVKYY